MSDNPVIHESYLGMRINQMLAGIGIDPLPDHLIMSLLVTLFLTGLAVMVHRNMKLLPQGLQNVFEKIFDMIEGMMKSIIGPEGPQYFPVIATLGLFILTGNLMGLFPFLGSPTSNINVTVGCALFVFLYYHVQGIRRHGLLRYLQHFVGPIWWMAPLMFPLEIISHLSRVMSLSLRLFGNIFGEDIILALLLLLSPWYLPIPVPMFVFAIFTSILQTYIFIMLSMMYIAGAVADESH